MAWATLYQMIACLAVTLCLRCVTLSVVLSQAQSAQPASQSGLGGGNDNKLW